ncbi:MAG: hypothetical protein WBV94_04445 [Blastocatellia bacterium]
MPDRSLPLSFVMFGLAVRLPSPHSPGLVTQFGSPHVQNAPLGTV